MKKNPDNKDESLVFAKETMHKELQEALIASEFRYRRLFESAKDGILILDGENGKIIDVNPFLIELLRYPKEFFLGKHLWEIGLFKDIVENETKFFELQKTEYVRYDHLPLRSSDGREINVEFVSNVYLMNKKKVIQCNIRDITERERTEVELARSETSLRTLVQTIPDLIWSKDLQGNYLSCNAMFCRFFGASEAEIVGKTDYDFVDKELADFFRENDSIAIAASVPSSNEEWITFADDGHRAFLETIKAPMFDKHHKLIGVLGIGRDLTQRKFAELELIKAKDKAEESDRLKSAFLANMSHEIRTPMNGILGFTELLKEPHLNIERQQEFLGIIERSGERMLSTINDIISISKIESGELDIYLSDINVNKLLDEIFNFFKPEAERKKLQFSFIKSISDEDSVIRSDKDKLYAILTNLVKNALKFTQNGSVEFGFEKIGEFLEFYVSDTGIGIVQSQKDIIFERFRQGSELLTRNYEGSGLGLPISKAFVEKLGGKIWFKKNAGLQSTTTNGYAAGSTFYFTIPKEKVKIKNSIPHKDTRVPDNKSQIGKLKVLLVEDDEVSAIAITFCIKAFVKEILIAGNGLEAIDLCRNNPDIDVILMDIKMPEMNGYEATRKIREFNKKVVIIGQSAFAMVGDKEKAIAAGCDNYITKPIDQRALRTMLNNIVPDQKP
ncbi:MAG: PAS domain S-box protein [Bacteroidales bacterium]|nr:PAS domain S-box protein [Bacteroidales bacterium]